MRTPSLSKFYRSHTCPSCKVKLRTGQRHDKEMCALGAFLRNGKNGYREKLALLLQENEKEKQTRRRWKGYVTLTEEDDDNVSRIFALKPHQVEDNEPQ